MSYFILPTEVKQCVVHRGVEIEIAASFRRLNGVMGIYDRLALTVCSSMRFILIFRVFCGLDGEIQ